MSNERFIARLAILCVATLGGISAGAAEIPVNTEVARQQARPALAIAPGGEILVAWESERVTPDAVDTIEGQLYDAAGAPLGGQFRISDAVLAHGKAPAVAVDGSGNFVVAWQGGGRLIRARRFAADGTAIGTFFDASADGWPDTGAPCVHVAAEADGDFAIAWIDFESHVALQRYAASGAGVGSRVVIGTAVDPQPQTCPSIAFDEDGNFAVSWITGPSRGAPREVHLRRFAANGAAIGGQIRVDDGGDPPIGPPSLVSDPNGNLLVAWVAENPPSPIWKPMAQRYSSAGVAQGGNFELHPQGSALRAAGDAAGNTVVAIDVDLSLEGIVGRRLGPDGNFLGGPLAITSTPAQHGFPAIAAEPGGRFIAAWAAVEADGNDPTLSDIFRNEPQEIEGVFADGFESGDTSRWN